jgi:hypothetical protein
MNIQKKEEILNITTALRMSSAADLITNKPHPPIFCHLF